MERISTYFLEDSPHMWTRDLREPALTFELFGQEWGFYFMNVMAWCELLAFTAVQSITVALLSVFVYKVVVQKQGTWFSMISCFAIAIPLLYLIPFGMFFVFNIRNQFMRFCIGAIMPVTCLFKTSAAAFGFLPKYATASIKSFAFYYTVPFTMEWNKKLDKYTPNTFAEVLVQLQGFGKLLIVMAFMKSLYSLIPDIVPPFATGKPDADYYSIASAFLPRTLLRNLLYICFICPSVTVMCYGFLVAQNIVTGVKACPAMDNPFLTSRSFSKFWGGKWNLVIHNVLKMGVYLPVRKYFSKHIAMIATFVASGLFHEVLLWYFMLPIDDAQGCLSDENARNTSVDCYMPRPFTTTLFFIWQAAGIAVEYSPLVKYLTFWDKVPTLFASMIIIFLGGAPLGHFFSEPYWNSLCLENAMIMFSFVKPMGAA
ncbi:Probable long-chain-alcohol O-fatty-acyltransferase [Seminavis robusta]|uniref:Probable long-chain-alcohol O-fatty-acyltransferase n=1 Tax=Seminavis robusta TaxID=568900 RepID=A0A9N8HCL6_9STRA|nr:Probable long-chain-alcohol O-fatty-acyltransferase [Seminavis robusta]|eukprot:Sro387_g132190.1 Probable long-chain-alcohol O-fatty-acyltransferase (428) ;mRNA; f:61282-62678